MLWKLLNRTCFFLHKKISKVIKEINKINDVLAVKHTEFAVFFIEDCMSSKDFKSDKSSCFTED